MIYHTRAPPTLVSTFPMRLSLQLLFGGTQLVSGFSACFLHSLCVLVLHVVNFAQVLPASTTGFGPFTQASPSLPTEPTLQAGSVFLIHCSSRPHEQNL